MQDFKRGDIHYGTVDWEWNTDKLVFYLNHSCDEWVIGGIEKAKQFAQDLLDLIEDVENYKK